MIKHKDMRVQTNQSISVDCVVFGFDGQSLKVLLVKRMDKELESEKAMYKLPGNMILENETLSEAAARVLFDLTGLKNLFLKQFHIYSAPDRVNAEELALINESYHINSLRVVTVGYYSLVKLNDQMIRYTTSKGAHWEEVDNIHHLVFDHMEILSDALTLVYKELEQSPIAFELLPKKFTIRQLQNLYCAILGVEIDNRNFRKRLLDSRLLRQTFEKEKGVAHKPAIYYTFNKNAFKKAEKNQFKLKFV